MTNAIPKGLGWEIVGNRFPNFTDKGSPICALDPDTFFPEGYNSHAREKQVTRFCKGCPYLAECLQFALENDEWGVWGGTTRYERTQMRRKLGYA